MAPDAGTYTGRVRIDTSSLSGASGELAGFTGKIGDLFKGLGAVIAGAFAVEKIVDFGKQSVQAYNDQQHAIIALQNSMANSPQLAGANIEAFIRLAEAQSQVTKFSKEQTEGGIAQLAQFHLTQGQIETLTPLVQDYAARTGKDMTEASTQVGKALEGNARALKEVGVNFKDLHDPTKNYNELVQDLRQQVGGFAEKEGKSAAGQAEILAHRWDDLKVAVGGALVNGFNAAIPIINGVVGVLLTLGDHMDVVGPILVGIAAGLGAIAVWVGVPALITAIGSAFAAVGDLLAANPFVLIIAGLVALGIALYEAYTHVSWFRDAVNAAFTWIKQVATEVWPTIAAVVRTTVEAISAVVSSVVRFVSDIWRSYHTQIVTTAQVAWSIISTWIKTEVTIIATVISAIVNTISFIWHNFHTQIVAVATTAWSVVSTIFKVEFAIIAAAVSVFITVVQTIVTVIQAVVTGVSAALGFLGNVFRTVFSAIVAVITPIVSTIVGIIGWIVGAFNNVMSSPVGGFLRTVFDGIAGAISAAVGAIVGVIQRIVDAFGAVVNAANNAKNAIVDAIRTAAGIAGGPLSNVVHQAAPGPLGGAGGGFAQGGKITSPTAAWIGEDGETEWVIPKHKAGPFAPLLDAMLGIGSINASMAGVGSTKAMATSSPSVSNTTTTNQPINVYVTNSNASPQDIASHLGWVLKTGVAA